MAQFFQTEVFFGGCYSSRRSRVERRGSTSLVAATQWLATVRVKALLGFYFGVRVTRDALCAGRGTAFQPVYAKAASRGIPLAAAKSFTRLASIVNWVSGSARVDALI